MSYCFFSRRTVTLSWHYKVTRAKFGSMDLLIFYSQCCGSGIRCFFDPGIRDGKKIRIRRSEIILTLDPGSGMEKFGSRNWDKHPGSATLGTVHGISRAADPYHTRIHVPVQHLQKFGSGWHNRHLLVKRYLFSLGGYLNRIINSIDRWYFVFCPGFWKGSFLTF